MSDQDLPVQVAVKDRVRLVMALLAASDWPQLEQTQRTHAVHPHAKETARFVKPFATHPAVVYANQLIGQGVPLEDLFAAALRSSWPDFRPYERLPGPLLDGRWVRLLAEFLQDTAVADQFWSRHRAMWDDAVTDLVGMFAAVPLAAYLTAVTGQPLNQNIIIIPNLVYPALATLVAETAQNLYVIVPPLLAVGESPPWPFREDPAAVQVVVCQALVRHLLAETLAQLDGEQAALLLHAASAVFLETAVDEAEAMAYLVRARKQHQLPALPAVVANLREFIANPAAGSLPAVLAI